LGRFGRVISGTGFLSTRTLLLLNPQSKHTLRNIFSESSTVLTKIRNTISNNINNHQHITKPNKTTSTTTNTSQNRTKHITKPDPKLRDPPKNTKGRILFLLDLRFCILFLKILERKARREGEDGFKKVIFLQKKCFFGFQHGGDASLVGRPLSEPRRRRREGVGVKEKGEKES